MTAIEQVFRYETPDKLTQVSALRQEHPQTAGSSGRPGWSAGTNWGRPYRPGRCAFDLARPTQHAVGNQWRA